MMIFQKIAFAALLVFSCLALGGATPTDQGQVVLAGAEWNSDFEAAKLEAANTGKPILLFDLIGRLDEKWC